MDHTIYVPDLGLGNLRMMVCQWLASEGDLVCAGERLLEITAAEVLLEVTSPVDGQLIKQFVEEDQEICNGQPLALVRSAE